MKIGFSTRRDLPTSVAAAGRPLGEGARRAVTEHGEALERLAEGEMEEVDQAALAELVEFASRPLI